MRSLVISSLAALPTKPPCSQLSELINVQGEAFSPATQATTTVSSGGVTAIWVLANISFAGMRAQANPNMFWRGVAFLAGFPGTLITLFFVREGEGRAYGIDLPKGP